MRMGQRAKLVLWLCIAAGLFALCILSGYLSPPLSSSMTLRSFLAGTLAPSPTRRLLSTNEVHPFEPGTQSPKSSLSMHLQEDTTGARNSKRLEM